GAERADVAVRDRRVVALRLIAEVVQRKRGCAGRLLVDHGERGDGAQVTFTERAFPCQRAARAVVARALTPSVRPREVRLCEDAIRLVPGGCGQEQALVAVAACLDRAGHTRCTAGRSRQYIDHPADRVTPVEGSHRTL